MRLVEELSQNRKHQKRARKFKNGSARLKSRGKAFVRKWYLSLWNVPVLLVSKIHPLLISVRSHEFMFRYRNNQEERGKKVHFWWKSNYPGILHSSSKYSSFLPTPETYLIRPAPFLAEAAFVNGSIETHFGNWRYQPGAQSKPYAAIM